MFNTWSNPYPYCYISISRDSVAPARPPEASSTQLPSAGAAPGGNTWHFFSRANKGFVFFHFERIFHVFTDIPWVCPPTWVVQFFFFLWKVLPNWAFKPSPCGSNRLLNLIDCRPLHFGPSWGHLPSDKNNKNLLPFYSLVICEDPMTSWISKKGTQIYSFKYYSCSWMLFTRY